MSFNNHPALAPRGAAHKDAAHVAADPHAHHDGTPTSPPTGAAANVGAGSEIAAGSSAVAPIDNTVAGCWCLSFEENIWRKEVCLACFHKRTDHGLPNSACGWKNLPKSSKSTLRLSQHPSVAPSLAPPFLSGGSNPSITPLAPLSPTSVIITQPFLPPLPSPSPPVPKRSINPPTEPVSPSTHSPHSPTLASMSAAASMSAPQLRQLPGKLDPAATALLPKAHAKPPAGGVATAIPASVQAVPRAAASPPAQSKSASAPAASLASTSSSASTPNPSFLHRGSPASTSSSNVGSASPTNSAGLSSPAPPPRSLSPANVPVSFDAGHEISKAFTPKSRHRNALVVVEKNGVVSPRRNLSKKILAQEYAALQTFDPVESITRMMRSLVWMQGVSTEEKFVKEFIGRVEAESLKSKSAMLGWSKRQMRERYAFGMSIKADVEHLLSQQALLQKIVLSQSCVRRYLTCKKIEGLKIYQQSPHRERNAIFRDLLRGERSYVSNLSLMVKGYLVPLKNALRSSAFLSSFTLTITADDLRSIFCNVEVLLQVHATVMGEFEILLDQWPVIVDIGAIFLKKAAEFRVYGEYVKNFQNALQTLTRLQEENVKFAQFLSERVDRNFGDPGLLSLISLPLNQISQYSILLEKLDTVTPSSHPDCEKLHAASVLMKEIYNLLRESIDQATNRAKMLDVQRRLLPHIAIEFDVMAPGRSFVHEGPVSVYIKKTKRAYHFVVFNNIFLLCRVKKNSLKLKHCLQYSQFVIESDLLPVAMLPPGTETATACAVVIPKGKFILIFSSKKEKTDFVTLVCNLVEKEDPNNRVFGSSLVALLKREKTPNRTIPSALEAMVEALRPRAEVEGIFRVSCAQKDLLAVREALENEETDVKRFDVHAVANVFKAYFREMPEPLLTYPAFDELTVITEELDFDARMKSLRVVLSNLPKPNRDVLQYIITFLSYVASLSEKNLMTNNNLSIVIGPNLIRPQVNTLETTLMMPKLNNIISDLMTASATVFNGI